MKTKKRFIEHYKSGFMPWVHKKADFNLIEIVENWPIKPCIALEVGCGTGTDAIWLAQKGFEVTALDVSDIPINIAIEQSRDHDLSVRFMVKDFLTEEIPGTPFDFVFDRGYLHSYDSPAKRKQVAKTMAASLKEGGLWLSLLGSCDSPPREGGPPMRSAREIVNATEPFFKIKLIKTSQFGTENENPANIWVCLFEKRG